MNNLSEQELIAIIKQIAIRAKEENLHFEDCGAGSSFRNDGSVQVKDQTIIIKDPKEGGLRPVLRPVWPVLLFVNGKQVTGEIAVSEADRCEWRMADVPLFNIRVSDDKMKVFLTVHAKERYAWRLSDGGPSTMLDLTAKEDRSVVLETLHYSDIVDRLEQSGIKVKLDMASIVMEVDHPSGKEILIAEGKYAVPGTDARLELYFPEEITHQFYEVDGAIDFRNHYQIPSVIKGQLIARKLPMVQGQTGYNVYGDIMVPEPPKDLMIVAKPSVQMLENGEIYALRDGRPRLTGTRIKTLDITTTHIEYGDVDFEKGNIVFSGDVVIYGNVNDNMIVESLGNVYVYGSVYHATITATGGVYVRGNVIGSKLYSGYFGVLFNRLYKVSKRLSEQISQLIAAARLLLAELKKRKQTAEMGQIVLLLIENNFKDIPADSKEMLDLLKQIQFANHEMFQKIGKAAKVFLHPHQVVETVSMNFLIGFLALLHDACRELEQMQETRAKTVIGQCHNSELKSHGDIVIKHDGVILSDLFASNDIIFERSEAVCRGSFLEAGRSIYAKIVGAETGTSTTLRAGESIFVKKMLFGKIWVGRLALSIEEPVENAAFTERSILESLQQGIARS